MKTYKMDCIPEDAKIETRWIYYIWGNNSGWIGIEDWEIKNPDFLIDVIHNLLEAYDYAEDKIDHFKDPIVTNNNGEEMAIVKCVQKKDCNNIKFTWWE